jgi:hypothetical protein
MTLNKPQKTKGAHPKQMQTNNLNMVGIFTTTTYKSRQEHI